MLFYICAFLVATVVVGRQFPTNERYIILLEKGSDAGDIEELIQSMEVHASSTREEMQVRSLTSLLPFVIGNMSEATAEMVSKLPNIKLIEKDQVMGPVEEAISYSPLMDSSDFHRYNLDILDNVDCTDNYFTPFNYGLGIDIYLVDSGINYDHIDFRWRNGTNGTRAKLGFDAVDDIHGTNEQGRDTFGTGTHLAGIAGGVDSGVAKDANLYSVRINDNLYHRSAELVLSGINAVARLHDINSKRSDFVGSIASLTLAHILPPSHSILEEAAMELVSKGIVVVGSSGSRRLDVCETSYCRTAVICVGAHDYDECTCKKKIQWNTGYGECVDVLAPGGFILSANFKSTNGYKFGVGSGVASSHVAGVAALMKAANPALFHYDILIRLSCSAVRDIDDSHIKRIFVSPELITN